VIDPRAKPTLFVPLVGIPAFSIFFFGGIAFSSLSGTDAPVLGKTTMEQIRDSSAVPRGAYVEVSRGALCVGMNRPDIDVHYADRTLDQCPPPAGSSHVSARVCDWPTRLGCGVPAEARRAIDAMPFDQRPDRVLLVGESPDDARRRMLQGIASSVIALAVYIAMVVFSRRRRPGPPRTHEERTWTLPYGADEILARVRKLEGTDRFLVVDEGPGRVVFIQGYSENAARGWGIRKADVFPRRATLTWTSSPREPTKVVARIDEDLVWWPAALTPTMDRLGREAIASTRAQIERVLVQP